MGEYIDVSMPGVHRGSASLHGSWRDNARKTPDSGSGSGGEIKVWRIDELHGSQGVSQERLATGEAEVCVGELDGVSGASDRGGSILLDLLRSAQRHEGIGSGVMEGHADFRERQLQVACDGHRHCNRASFRQLYGNIRTAEQAKRDRERVAKWSAYVLLGICVASTAVTLLITYLLWLRLDQIASR